MRSGQQCCYYANGDLATSSPAGGTVDLVSPEVSTLEHFLVDVLPSVACCFGLFSNCEAYYEERPSDDGSRYNPPPPGEPHTPTSHAHSSASSPRETRPQISHPLLGP